MFTITSIATDWAIPANTAMLVILALVNLLQNRTQKEVQKQVVGVTQDVAHVHEDVMVTQKEAVRAHKDAGLAAVAAARAAEASVTAARISKDIGGALRHTADVPRDFSTHTDAETRHTKLERIETEGEESEDE